MALTPEEKAKVKAMSSEEFDEMMASRKGVGAAEKLASPEGYLATTIALLFGSLESMVVGEDEERNYLELRKFNVNAMMDALLELVPEQNRVQVGSQLLEMIQEIELFIGKNVIQVMQRADGRDGFRFLVRVMPTEGDAALKVFKGNVGLTEGVFNLEISDNSDQQATK